MSGSTGVITVIFGKLIYTANVGDSGAILFEEEGAPLTYFQPYKLSRE